MSDVNSKINQNVAKLNGFDMLGFNQKLAKYPDLIQLTVGEPDFNTPEHVKKAGIKAIEDNHSHYANPRGITELRKNAASFLKIKYNLNYDYKTQVIVTNGVSEAMETTMQTLLNPGDTVIILTPVFPVYIPCVTLNGAKPVFLNTADNDYKLDPKKLDQLLRTHQKTVKAVVFNYPSNPTGVTYTKDELQAIADVIKKYDVYCISDEIYSELTYTGKHVSIATMIPDQTIPFNGVSKSHAMTGWRIGIVCGPAEIINKINTVHTLTVTSTADVAQYAAAEAFGNGLNDAEPMKKIYEQRCQILKTGLDQAGFTSPQPKGTFYIFAKVPAKFNQNSVEFAYQLAEEALVGTMPGVSFGPGGEGYLRFSYAASTENIKKAVQRIQAFVD